MIIALRNFIQKQGVVSSQQLTREFQVDEPALKPMLEIWLNKGIIKKCQANRPGCASSCGGCKEPPEYYQIA